MTTDDLASTGIDNTVAKAGSRKTRRSSAHPAPNEAPGNPETAVATSSAAGPEIRSCPNCGTAASAAIGDQQTAAPEPLSTDASSDAPGVSALGPLRQSKKAK